MDTPRRSGLGFARTPTVWLVCLGLLACAQPGPPAPTPTTGPSFRIVALGDSYASGQGAPDEEWKWWKCGTPRWDDRRCNRSLNAATYRAVEILRQQGHAVAFDSFACSGAKIEVGLTGPYDGSEPPVGPHPPLPPQVDELSNLVATGGADAVTISIGGNDVLFAFIVGDCIALPNCNVSKLIIDQSLADLTGRLALLEQKLSAIPIDSERIFILGYPNPTQDSDGSYCDGEPPNGLLARVSGEEAKWVAEYVLPRLNRTICLAAQSHGWTYIGGAASRFEQHGWCAQPQNWINTFEDSGKKQRHPRGAVHPNRAGYGEVGDLIATAVAPLLVGESPTSSPCPPILLSP
jgi:hypothetical protein